MSHTPSISYLLKKLQITSLNPMQEAMQEATGTSNQIKLVSPTGSGKTLAFLLPLIQQLDPTIKGLQALVIVPTRELAVQIEQVARDLGSGFKINAVYGGRSGAKDRAELKQIPSLLIGTPGRLADRFYRDDMDLGQVSTIVLDEFDKSLEIGFEKDIKEILESLPSLKKKWLTSATEGVDIPSFMRFTEAKTLNFTPETQESKLEIVSIDFNSREKAKTLLDLLGQLDTKRGIVFCNFKDAVHHISEYLKQFKLEHTVYHGGMEQMDRERALIKFRNGSSRLLIATDLAARGLDIPELHYIIHYQLPPRAEEYTHRNGRTARMHAEGKAFVLLDEDMDKPDFIAADSSMKVEPFKSSSPDEWTTLFIAGGRKDKISKGDIAGLLMKDIGLDKSQVGLIELKQDCAFVAVSKAEINRIVQHSNGKRLKKKKVRTYEI